MVLWRNTLIWSPDRSANSGPNSVFWNGEVIHVCLRRNCLGWDENLVKDFSSLISYAIFLTTCVRGDVICRLLIPRKPLKTRRWLVWNGSAGAGAHWHFLGRGGNTSVQFGRAGY